MELILIGVLFVLQLISFYLIVLLKTKLGKYKDLELKQQKLIEEMDNSIGAYLFEMKEENDRLIQELQANSTKQQMIQEPSAERTAPVAERFVHEPIVPAKPEKNVVHVPKAKAASVYERNIESQASLNPNKVSEILNGVTKEPVQTLTFEQKVKKMFEEGQTIEQIAKNTNKGKTEIELLLKFSS